MNGPGCLPITRPIITRTKMSVVKNQHFEKFFSDRENVAMSSYKVDSKTNLPILYLKDQKEALWHKFSEIYPDGMKRTSFMARLANGPFKYREDLGGLCIICSEYGYQIFENLCALVNVHISNKNVQVKICKIL